MHLNIVARTAIGYVIVVGLIEGVRWLKKRWPMQGGDWLGHRAGGFGA